MQGAGHGEQEKVDEVGVISVSAAGVHPGAVMIHLQHASIALSAVVTSWRLVAPADLTVLQIES